MNFSTKKKAGGRVPSWRKYAEDAGARAHDGGGGDAEDTGTSEAFAKIQRELKEQARLRKAARRRELDEAARVGETGDGVGQPDELSRNSSSSSSLSRAAGGGAYAEARRPAPTLIVVTGLAGNTRLHDVKARMHQFGEVVSMNMVHGRSANVP